MTEAGGVPLGQGPKVMKVRTELVLEQLVSRVLGTALELQSAELGAESQAVLEAAPEPARLARLGYASRAAEVELFDPARRPMPWLAETLAARIDSGEDGSAAICAVCRELAAEEPDSRPEPGQGSWRVPGPGGHVRHFLALAATDELAQSGSDGEPSLSRGLSAGEAKRCFLYGFYARCCEEAEAASRS